MRTCEQHLTTLFDLKPAFQAVKAIFSKSCQNGFALLSVFLIQNMRHAQTLIRECFAFSARPCASQPHILNSQPASSYVLTSTSRVNLMVLFIFVWVKHDKSLFCPCKFEQSHSKTPCYQVKEQAYSKHCQDI